MIQRVDPPWKRDSCQACGSAPDDGMARTRGWRPVRVREVRRGLARGRQPGKRFAPGPNFVTNWTPHAMCEMWANRWTLWLYLANTWSMSQPLRNAYSMSRLISQQRCARRTYTGQACGSSRAHLGCPTSRFDDWCSSPSGVMTKRRAPLRDAEATTRRVGHACECPLAV